MERPKDFYRILGVSRDATTAAIKRAYRRLSHLLVEGDLLPEAELMYFLTHDEIGRLVRSTDPVLAAKAAGRRSAYGRQRDLEFPPIFQGTPLPMEPAPAVPDGEVALAGKPVSRGVVEGTARVVRTLEEAAAIRPGEILIAPVTDVGWTPYFNLIAGIATDLGSVISHGAVIAREYGLPAVVNSSRAVAIARAAAWDTTTVDKVVSQGYPSLGGEDFSFYQQYVEGCLVRFGAALPAPVGPAHSPTFDFDEKCLAIGAAWLANVGWRWLNTNGRTVVLGDRMQEG